MARILWTEEEDKVLRQCVAEGKNNLRGAFEKCHRLLPERSIYACATRWYYITGKTQHKKEGIEFMLPGKKDTLPNRKFTRRNKKPSVPPVKNKKGYWRNLLDALFGRECN